jgi:hypothetical protein
MVTVLCRRQGGELACPNFLLSNQEVAPLTFIAEFRTPYAAVSEVEDNRRTRPTWRLGAPHCVIRFRVHSALPFTASGEMRVYCACHIGGLRGDMGTGWPCAAVACSFIALAACLRQLPFWRLNSRVVTECLQSTHLNALKPFIILIV